MPGRNAGLGAGLKSPRARARFFALLAPPLRRASDHRLLVLVEHHQRELRDAHRVVRAPLVVVEHLELNFRLA
jgi:hypothetical protein